MNVNGKRKELLRALSENGKGVGKATNKCLYEWSQKLKKSVISR